MAGHSKWAQIKHKKAKTDKERGKIFSKLIREITVAAREGGGNPEFNPRLRLAIERAKAQNMPQDNIERAIKKGTGELEGAKYEKAVFEGYGPGGVAIMVVALTDNKNRTTGEVRHIFSVHNSSLSTPGSVAWQFEEKGIIYIKREELSEDELLNILSEVEITDINLEEDTYEIVTSPKSLQVVKGILEESNINISHFEVTMIPQSKVKLDDKTAEKLLKLVDSLEEHDDVQSVYANFDISDETLKILAESR